MLSKFNTGMTAKMKTKVNASLWGLILLLVLSLPLALQAEEDVALKNVEQLLNAGALHDAKLKLTQLRATQARRATSGQINLEIALLDARILMADNKLEQASDQLKALLKTTPNNAKVYYWYGIANSNLAGQASIFTAGSYANKAKNSFIKAVALDPNYIPGYKGLIGFYISAPAIVGGSMKKAEQMVQRLYNVSELQGTLSQLQLAKEDNDTQLEVKLISTLFDKFNNSATAQFTAGLYYQQQKQYEQAYQAFLAGSSLPAPTKGIGESDREFNKSKLSALYQLGRNAVFSERHIPKGIAALNEYLTKPISTALPSKEWARFRLAKLYVLNHQVNLAKPILIELRDGDYEDELSTLAGRELQAL